MAMLRAAAIALLLVGTSAFGSPPDPCSLTSTATDAKVTISIPAGQTSFREGEIIPLVLSFTSTADKRYWAENRGYDRSGRLSTETYCVEPAARDPLADYFRTGGFIGGGLGSDQQLSEKPFTATAELNEWRQPGPGHYRLYVVSHRVWRPPDPGEPTPYGRVSVTLRSNTIEFDVMKAGPDWLAGQLQEATAAYQNTTGEQQKEAARRLRFLNTKESTETLARLFWGLNDQPAGFDLMFGLFGSPYRAEAIAAMQTEINDPDHPITQGFLYALTKLQIEADPAWDPPTFNPARTDAWQEYWGKRRAHERELMRAAVAATAAALPQKTGRARAQTVLALVASSDLLSPPTAAQMRQQLIAVWGDLPENTKLELIQFGWPVIGGPDMLPILKEFVSRPVPPLQSVAATARDAALKHIFDLNPDEGRSLILQDFRDPKAQPSISLVKLLSADDLRPIVQQAIERIKKNDARDLDFHLLELFGDKSALSAVEHVYNDRAGQWACDPQDAMLRYFLRLDPEFGASAVEASLAARKTTGCYRMLLQDLGKVLPQVQQTAIGALDDKDLEVANDAALALGRWGTPKAEAALWARLERFHKEWQGREAELRFTPDYQSSAARAAAFESTLVSSIATGTNWICGPEKLERLRALASPREQMQIASWSKGWGRGVASILPNWFPEDRVSFGVLQYSNLDEEQFRAKLSQLPAGMKLYFQIWKPGQISPPVSMEKQEAVFQALRDYGAQFGVTIEEKIGR
ncbi:MAG: hypothetical protein KGL59_08580 [Acidobacteriota bacterium]|nr:hypothetical protein [Acidobacteriota bacterium]